MRAHALILFGLAGVGCTGEPAAELDTDAVDRFGPRFDPLTWPSEVGPQDRPATLITPTLIPPSEGLPLIVVLHGYGANGGLQQRYFRLGERVSEGFVVLAPNGTVDAGGSRFWNATDACCDFGQTGVDDVGYLLGLLDEVEASVAIDPDRIVLVGHSNGGFMSYRLACEAPDRIAGIASLAGVSFEDADSACGATEPVSVLQIHGTADSTIPYEGGQIRNFPPVLPSARDSVAWWADLAGCGATRDDGPVDYDATQAGPDSTRTTWTDCGDHDMQLWTIEDGVHIPMLTPTFDDDLLGWLLAQRR